MTNLQKAEEIIKRIIREKKGQPNQEGGENWRKIWKQAIADELKRADDGSGLHEREKAIYALYPRKIAPQRAYTAILKAIKLHGYEHVLQKTEEYAVCVKRWSHDYRFRGSAGSDIVPHPASWFNAGSYDDDPTEWIGDRRYNIDPAPASKVFQAPLGWQTQLTIKYPDWVIDGNGVKSKAGKHIGWSELPIYMQKELAA